MAIRPPDDRVLDDSRILAEPDFRTDRILAGPNSRTQAILASPSIAQTSIAQKPLVGKYSAGDIIWAGVISNGQNPTPFFVRLTNERKHPTGKPFKELRHAQAEAEASFRVCAIHRSGPVGNRRFRVFETDTHREFLANFRRSDTGRATVTTTRHPPLDFVSLRNTGEKGPFYQTAAERMRATHHAERGEWMRRILVDVLGIDRNHVGVVRNEPDGYRYAPGRLNADGVESLMNWPGLTIYVDRGGVAVTTVPQELPEAVPPSAVILGYDAFDPRTPLMTWGVVIHEETHLRAGERLTKVAAKWREARAQGDTRPFPRWLAAAHAARQTIGGVAIDDATWLTMREMVGDLTYEGISFVGANERRPLGQCLAALNGFVNVFHNLDLTALRSDGRDYEATVFGQLDYCAEHWAAPRWNSEIGGFSGRLLAQWIEYVRLVRPFLRGEVIDRATAKSEGSIFYADLLAGLKV